MFLVRGVVLWRAVAVQRHCRRVALGARGSRMVVARPAWHGYVGLSEQLWELAYLAEYF